MLTFSKTAYEQINRFHDFGTIPTGWLGPGETVASAAIVVTDSAGNTHPEMLANVSQSGTEALYTIQGGTPGSTYKISIQIVTSSGQQFEDDITLGVKS